MTNKPIGSDLLALAEPKVWNKRDPNVPADAVYVGRGTPWGNPFKLFKEADRDLVCDLFEERVLPNLDVTALAGKHLICWCAPKRCHADALLVKARARATTAPNRLRSE